MKIGRRGGLFVLGGGWALAATLSGLLLLGAWLFTDHRFWYENFNLFQLNPLFLPLPLALFVFLSTGRFPRWGRDLSALLAAVSLLGLAIQLLPGVGQGTAEILAFTVPVNLSLGLGARLLHERAGSVSGEGTTPLPE